MRMVGRSGPGLLRPYPEDAAAKELSEKLARAAEAAGADVIVDDRAERPGVKFKDADLIGIPFRIAVGKKGLADGVVELKLRRSPEVRKVKIDEIVGLVAGEIAKERR